MGEPKEVSNEGLVRPPLIYLGALALGLILQRPFPVSVVPPSVGVPVGAALVVLAVGLFIVSVRTMSAAGTPVPGDRPTTTIVRRGPFKFSRNPIYLAFSLLLLGIALWADRAWLLLTLVGAVGVMDFIVIPREERYLAARFPAEYPPYKAAVRRWL